MVAVGVLGRGAESLTDGVSVGCFAGGRRLPARTDSSTSPDDAWVSAEETADLNLLSSATAEAPRGGWCPVPLGATQFIPIGSHVPQPSSAAAVLVWPWERVLIKLDSSAFAGTTLILESVSIARDDTGTGEELPLRRLHVTEAKLWTLQSSVDADAGRMRSWLSAGAADL